METSYFEVLDWPFGIDPTASAVVIRRDEDKSLEFVPGETLLLSEDESKRGFTHRELHTKIIEKDAKVLLWAADPDVEPKAASLPLRGPKTLRQVLQSIDQTLVPVLRSGRRTGGGSVAEPAASPPGPFRTDIRARMASVGSSSSEADAAGAGGGGASGCGGGGGRRGVIIGISELPGRRLEYVLEVEEGDEEGGEGGAAAAASAAPAAPPASAAAAPAAASVAAAPSGRGGAAAAAAGRGGGRGGSAR